MRYTASEPISAFLTLCGMRKTVFAFFIYTHLKNEKNGKRLRYSVQCVMSFSVLPMYDPYLAIFYLGISILCQLDVGIDKLYSNLQISMITTNQRSTWLDRSY